jgi:hypothetical protein
MTDRRHLLPQYDTVITTDASGCKPDVPKSAQRKPFPTIPPCPTVYPALTEGAAAFSECLNGPPSPLVTYSLCEACRRAAPDPFALGWAFVPPKGVTKEVRRKMAIPVFSGVCLLRQSGVQAGIANWKEDGPRYGFGPVPERAAADDPERGGVE